MYYYFNIFDRLKPMWNTAIHGFRDGENTSYGKNMVLRASEGAGIGAGTGAIAGNIVGRLRRRNAGITARNAASQGIGNKILNAINSNRLNNIEDAARKNISLTKHTLLGAGIGAGTGAGIGAGAGALETHLKRKDAADRAKDVKILEQQNKIDHLDRQVDTMKKRNIVRRFKKWVKNKKYEHDQKKKKKDENKYTTSDFFQDAGANMGRLGYGQHSLRNSIYKTTQFSATNQPSPCVIL